MQSCSCGKPILARGMCSNHYSQMWHKANPEKRRAKKKKWEDANRDKTRAAVRRYYRKHRTERQSIDLARAEAWRKANPDRHAACEERRRARKLGAPGNGVTPDQWQDIADGYVGLCAYCNERRKLQMDHIEPLGKGGAHDVSNVAPACGPCNRSKSTKQLLVWLALRAA